VTFTGSVVAYGKLAGKVLVQGEEQLPGGHMLNAAAAACLGAPADLVSQTRAAPGRWCC
jgi:NAD/NADP transhydrogenase beta subunit